MDIYERLRQSDGDVIIFGAGFVGRFILERCRQNGVEVVAFCDNSSNKQGTFFDGIPVESFETLTGNYDKMKFILALNQSINNVVEQIKSKGDHEYFTANNFYELDELKDFDLVLKHRFEYAYYVGKWHNEDHLNKVNIRNVEFVVTERCSLKCKNCANLMQYYQKPQDYPLEDLTRQLDRFTEVCSDIYELRLIGGEPFVYSKLDHLITYIADKPNVYNLSIFTNGTIIPNDRIMDALSLLMKRGGGSKNVYISISDYGKLSRNMSALIEKCDRYGVPYEVKPMDFWFRLPTIKKYNRNEKALKNLYTACFAKECYSLFQGKFFHCPYIAHGINLHALPDEPSNYVDLMTTDDIDDLRRQLREYIEDREYLSLCDYCYPHSTLNVRDEDKVPPAEQISRPLQYRKFE